MKATFKSLTPTQRTTLLRCVAQGIPADDTQLKPAIRKALEKLQEKGLVHVLQSRKKRPLWRATDVGRGLVGATGLIPILLHRQSQYGYTSNPSRAMVGEPEAFYRDAA